MSVSANDLRKIYVPFVKTTAAHERTVVTSSTGFAKRFTLGCFGLGRREDLRIEPGRLVRVPRASQKPVGRPFDFRLAPLNDPLMPGSLAALRTRSCEVAASFERRPIFRIEFSDRVRETGALRRPFGSMAS